MAKSKARKKSQAPVALVYFVTLVLCLGLLAGISYYLLDKFNILNSEEETKETSLLSCVNTMYARVNGKGVLADLCIIRMDPNKQQIVVVPMSALTISKGSSKNFRKVLEDGGITKLRDAVSDTYGISIDNYASVTYSAFESCIDILGGMSYTAEQELYYLSQDSDSDDISIAKGEVVSLSGHQIRLICHYPVFAEGKAGNVNFLGEALEQSLNNGFRQAPVTRDNLTNMYNIITKNSDTDITIDEFTVIKSYMTSMLNAGTTPAYAMVPTGTWAAEDKSFTPDDSFIETLGKVFSGETNVSDVESQSPVGEAADDAVLASKTDSQSDSKSE